MNGMLSVLILAFNEKEVIEHTYHRLKTAMDSTGSDYELLFVIIIIYADLQDPPELIPAMINKWREGFDVVYAKRTARKGETFFKKRTAALFYRTLRRMTDTESSLSAAPIILNTKHAVMAMGGFSGSDPALTAKKLEKLAKAGEVKYFLVSGRQGAMGRGSQKVTDWIKKNCDQVPSSEWNSNKEKNTLRSGPDQDQALYVYKG